MGKRLPGRRSPIQGVVVKGKSVHNMIAPKPITVVMPKGKPSFR